jgi:hypothetical protein
MAGGAFGVSFTQLVLQLEQSEREILKFCLSLGDLRATLLFRARSGRSTADLTNPWFCG